MIAADALVVGLGGNIGDDTAIVARFGRAREALAQLGSARSAPLYRTAAIGPTQRAFLNTAVLVRVADASAGELIATLLEIERLLGRQRSSETRWGPRSIDLDILVWGERLIRTPELEVPHPRLAERRFALRPLIALLGDVAIPGARQTAGSLDVALRDQAIEQIAETW